MSLKALQEDFSKYELDRRTIIKKIIELLPMNELLSTFGDLIIYEINNITVNLDNKTTLNIIYTIEDIKFSVITPEETYTVIFPYLCRRYTHKDFLPLCPHEDSLELSYFYTTLEPYKEVLEDKIEEGFRKEIDFNRLVKKED